MIFLIFLLMCKPKFGEPAFSCHFGCAMFVQLTFWSSHSQSCRTHPTIGTTPWFSYLYTKHKSLSFDQHTLSSHSKLYQCLAFVSFTIDATTQRISGTTLWFVSLQDWIIIGKFQKPLHFVQKYGQPPFLVSLVAILGAIDKLEQPQSQLQHPPNHWH